MNSLTVQPGKPLPMGACLMEHGVNFSVFTRNGTQVVLDIFRDENSAEPYFSYTFDPVKNRTGDLWHVYIEGLEEGALYLYRVDGPFKPEKGLRFNRNVYLIDPYAKALTDASVFRSILPGYSAPMDKDDIDAEKPRSAAGFPKCVVVSNDFDWQGDRPLNCPLRNSILNEAHLKGMTRSPSSGVAHPGTYRGIIEKIPYFRELGITSIEFLPLQEFDEYENMNVNPRTGERLYNYWGYSTIAFFAPKTSYSSDRSPGGSVAEFKEMVRELHKNGIEIILDIVFNHTAEGNEHGVTMSFRGFDNPIYYMLEEEHKQYYKNYSGCGNTVNCNHPVMRSFIIDCLRYWVIEMHVDGFRFDLGSILGRDQNGHLMEDPPVLERIAEDPVLRDTKIIAEAWDAGGAYQVGFFPGGRWSEWNDRFRDDLRRFWRGDNGMVTSLATRVTGSSDLYLRDGRKPFHSVNFITSHDGFTLNALVSYNGKHNDENGENNRDGSNNNYSYNYGYEGPTVNGAIEKVRVRQIKNYMLSLLLSLGTPMLQAGDEFRRSQGGNNNAYCQDTPVSWIDWTLKEKNAGLFRFVRHLIGFRRRHPAFRRPEYFTGQDKSYHAIPDITWFDENGRNVDWSKINQFIAYRLDGGRADILADRDDNNFFIMYNASPRDITVRVPSPENGKRWYAAIDTARESPADIYMQGEEEILENQHVYILESRSGVVLISR